MKLTQILMELDTREEKYPGIKKGELVKAYKERIKKQKDGKAATNKRYRTKVELQNKSMAWHKKDLAYTSTVIQKLPKEKNKWFLPASIDVNKGSFNPATEDKAFPITKKVAAAIKLRTPSRGVEVNSIRYWGLDTADYADAMDVLGREVEAYMKDTMTPEEIIAYYESETAEDLELIIEAIEARLIAE